MFDPEGNLKIAMMIYEDKNMNNEAGIRTAVSRCYYSSLLTVKPLLQLDAPDVDNDDLHMVVIDLVRKADRTLGDRLKFLYGHRLKADLSASVTWDKDVILDVHGTAKHFNSDIGPALQASDSSLPAP